MNKATGKGRLHIIRRKQGAQAVREALAAHGQAGIQHGRITLAERKAARAAADAPRTRSSPARLLWPVVM